MRNRWDDRGSIDLDAPATITERELRALRRRAGFGVPAVLLALVSVGGLGWTLFTGPAGLEQIQHVKERILTGTTSVADAGSTETQGPAAPQSHSTDPALARPLAADSVSSTPSPAASSSNREESGRLATQGSGK